MEKSKNPTDPLLVREEETEVKREKMGGKSDTGTEVTMIKLERLREKKRVGDRQGKKERKRKRYRQLDREERERERVFYSWIDLAIDSLPGTRCFRKPIGP